MTLWNSAEIEQVVQGRATAAFAVEGIGFDSRAVGKGDLFVALPGSRADGHSFVAGAFASGAAAALVTHRPAEVAADEPIVLVEDTRAALDALAAAARARVQAAIIGVTGSVGKTGTKEALRAALSATGPTHASAGSFNNHVGVPLSLARMPRDTRFAVFEMGMNHAGELGPLSRLVRPDIAVVTNVEPVHMEFFPDVQAVADAKAEIFEGMAPGGQAVLNADNAQFGRLAAAARARGLAVTAFGTQAGADVRLLDLVLMPDHSLLGVEVMGTPIRLRLGAPGRHWAVNVLAVLAAAALAGGDLQAAARALAELSPPAGRGRRHSIGLPGGGRFLLIDESYNASPASMRAAFAALALVQPGAGGRRIAVLGDMRELGTQAAALHAGLAPAIEAAGIDLVLACGPHMASLAQALPARLLGLHETDSAALAPRAAAVIRDGDIVMVKGSLGSHMAAIIARLLALDSSAPGQSPSGA